MSSLLSKIPGAGPNAVLAIGHRGAAAHMPENTMPSFEKALELGADALEFDVALTSDGVPVVIHDDTLDRTTNGRGPVEQATLSELRRLDAGSWKGVRTHLPTLDEVLEGFASRTLLNLEIKESPRRGELVGACAHAVTRHQASAQVVFSSFDHDALRVLRQMLPQARIGVLSDTIGLDRALACAEELGAENLHLPLVLVTRGLVDGIHDKGRRVWTWTVNDDDWIRRMIACRVDGIFSDWPERVVAARD